eukprot:UN07085
MLKMKSAENRAVHDKSLANSTMDTQGQDKNEDINDINDKKVEDNINDHMHEAQCAAKEKEEIQTDTTKQAKDTQGNSDKPKEETPKNNDKMEVDNE